MGTHLTKVVLTSTHNLCFEQKYEKYQNFFTENFHFLVVKFSVYLNRHVFVIIRNYYKMLSVEIFTQHAKTKCVVIYV